MGTGSRQGRGPYRRRHLCRLCLRLARPLLPLSRTIHFPTPLRLFLPLLLLPTHPPTHTCHTLTLTLTHPHTHTRITTINSTTTSLTRIHNNTCIRIKNSGTTLLTRLTRPPLPPPHPHPPWINHLHNRRRSPDRPRRPFSRLNTITQRYLLAKVRAKVRAKDLVNQAKALQYILDHKVHTAPDTALPPSTAT